MTQEITMDEKNNESLNGNMMHELKERVKELNCFYRITKIVNDSRLSIDEALQKIVELIPPAWQFPDLACARIVLEKRKEFKTENFKKTKWILESNLVVDEKKIGVLEVHYLEEKPPADEGPFLLEERRLIDAISNVIGKFIEERHIKEELEQQRRRLDQVQKIMKAEEKEAATKAKAPEIKHDWEVILDLLVKTDPRTLLRLTRKMTYYLYRIENEKVTNLLNRIAPSSDSDSSAVNWRGISMPNQRQDLDALVTIQREVFEIAKECIPADVISDLFANWMKQDKARPLLLQSQKTGIPLVEIAGELNRFFDQPDAEGAISPEDQMSIKTALVRRFFTERLEYVNVAKMFFNVKDFDTLLEHVVGPAQGTGKLGGKSSGVLLAEKIIKEEMKKDDILKDIAFPKNWYITSDSILSFIHYNDLDEVSHVKYLDPIEILEE